MKSSAVPSRLPDGLWNCSEASWPDFQQHLTCNLITECAGGEDEQNCPYTGPCGQGRLTWQHHCYDYIVPGKVFC